jgi:hypothetical protein
MSSGMRSFGVTRHGHNLEDTYGLGLHVRLGEKRYTIRIMYNPSIRRRLDGYSRD